MILDLLILIAVIVVLVKISGFLRNSKFIGKYRTFGATMFFPLLILIGLSNAFTYIIIAILAIPKIIWACIVIAGFIRIKFWKESGYELIKSILAMLFWLLLPVAILGLLKV